jgi:catechol 2,3-dioxygenase-like lactoylglutathione lyase family enzyme
MPTGFNHVGLSTNDLDATIDFYTRVLGFSVARYDLIRLDEGREGLLKHAFIDVGHHQFLAFLDASEVPSVEGPIDTGLNTALRTPRTFYHIAFDAPSERWLEEFSERLHSFDVPTSHIIDHEWCKSISLLDPVNKLELEFCTQVRDLTPEEALPVHRFGARREQLDQRVEDSRLAYYP